METLEPLKKTNGKVTILLIEDSVTQAQQLQYTLEEEHFEVDWVKNGKEALKYLETKIPTIIVSDIMMPEMNGFEFCAVIKKEPRYTQIPIILLTMLSDPQDIIRGLDSGADNFITKPYDREYLLSRITYILANQKLRRISEKRSSEMGLEIFFAGKKQFITSEKMQILDLLFSTFEAVIQKNGELERRNKELKEAHENIKVLKGLIPICYNCKKVRKDDGFWEQVDIYISEHSEADFTHSLCPDCLKECYPDLEKQKE